MNKFGFLFAAVLTALILSGMVFATISGPPTGFFATVAGNQINLAWTGSTTDTNGTIYYKVFRDTNSGVSTADSNIAFTTSTSFSDTTVIAGTIYYYSALAFDTSDSSETALSNEDNATIPIDSTVPTISVADVNGDASAPYWARTSQGVKLNLGAGEGAVECKWSDSNSATYAAFGTLCTTSGTSVSCDLGTRTPTTAANITTYYNCKDSMGNATGGIAVVFGNDYTSPTGSVSASVSENDATITYSASDAHSGITKIEVKRDSESYVDKGSSASGTHVFSDLSNGSHAFTLRVTDIAGNSFETTSNSVSVDFNSASTNLGTPSISS
ncbi:MAG: hypothetical protein NUV67_00740, partial [archaeon]|nr:hypothetical protein [archaeon]